MFLVCVYLTSTRGAQLAFVIGMLYLLVRCWRVVGGRKMILLAFIPLVLGGVLLVSGLVGPTRTLPSLTTLINNPFKFTSTRSNLWPLAIAWIKARPLFGWSFNGFGLAWPRVNDFEVRWKTYLARNEQDKAIGVVKILRNNHNTFVYLGTDGKPHLVRGLTNKAHNILLDTTVSVGLVGAAVYTLLFGFFFWVTARGAGWGLEAVAVVYLAFGLTWFESAQFSHLPWWALSGGLAFYRWPGLRGGGLASLTKSPQKLIPNG